MSRKRKSRFGAFLFGIFFGIVITIGGLAYGLYWTYGNLTVAKVEELTKKPIMSDESPLKTLTIKKLAEEVKKIPDMTVSTFATTYGIKFEDNISFLIDALGDTIIKDIPTSGVNSILSNVKLGNILGTPYNDFESYPIEYDGALPENADTIFFELRHYAISGENSIANYFNTLTLGKVENLLGFNLPDMLESIPKDTLMSDLGSAIENVPLNNILPKPSGWIDEDLSTHDVIAGDDFTTIILKRIRTMQKTVSSPEESTLYTINEMNLVFERLPQELLISDILSPDDNKPANDIANNIISAIVTKGGTISEINNVLIEVLDELTVTSLFGETSSTEGIFILLRGKDVNGDLKDLKISEMSTLGVNNVKNATLEDFQESGVIDPNTDLTRPVDSTRQIKDLTIDEFLSYALDNLPPTP